MRPERLEILEDRTAESRCDEGFLTLRRLRVRHAYPGGAVSPDYDCDVVSRRGVDAVAVVLWQRGADGRVRVVLKEGVRPPVWLRRQRDLVEPDPHAPLVLTELVAGMLEAGDAGADGRRRRGRAESREEAGLDVPLVAFESLGGALFPSPGITDERVEFLAAQVARLPEPDAAAGDGSGMEHGTRAVVWELDDALAACRDGRILDMKTEVGLARLRDRLRVEERVT